VIKTKLIGLAVLWIGCVLVCLFNTALDRTHLSPMQRLKFVGTGALAGAIWFLLPLFFDTSVKDMQDMQPIPIGHTGACIAALGCAMVTGALIALVFYRCLGATGIWFFLLPIVTVPVAIAIFSVLLWFVRGWFGIHSHLSSHDELVDILAIYLVYGLISLFAPFVYGFALLTQYAFRLLSKRAA